METTSWPSRTMHFLAIMAHCCLFEVSLRRLTNVMPASSVRYHSHSYFVKRGAKLRCSRRWLVCPKVGINCWIGKCARSERI